MATTPHNPLTSKFYGHVGPCIYYVVHNQQRIRSMPSHVYNPRTPGQVAHRARFATANSIAAIFGKIYQVGYRHAHRDLDPRSTFVKHIYHDALNAATILNPNNLHLSKGTLQIFQPTRVDLDGSRLTLRWSISGGSTSDRLCICLYNYTRGMAETYLDHASRAAGRTTITVRADCLSDHLYLYCFWHNPDTRKVSTSVVAAEFNNPDNDEARDRELLLHIENLSIGWKNPLRTTYRQLHALRLHRLKKLRQQSPASPPDKTPPGTN